MEVLLGCRYICTSDFSVALPSGNQECTTPRNISASPIVLLIETIDGDGRAVCAWHSTCRLSNIGGARCMSLGP